MIHCVKSITVRVLLRLLLLGGLTDRRYAYRGKVGQIEVLTVVPKKLGAFGYVRIFYKDVDTTFISHGNDFDVCCVLVVGTIHEAGNTGKTGIHSIDVEIIVALC
jgi:hypothetical protein